MYRKSLYKKLVVLFGILLFIPILSVNALEPIELTQTIFDAAKNNEAGAPDYISYEDSHGYTINVGDESYDFILSSDIDLGADLKFINGNYNLNLNGKLLDCSSFDTNGVDMVISGNGTVNGSINFQDSHVTIKNGTFNKHIAAWWTELIIEDATVYSGEYGYALESNGTVTFEIRGGTYIVSEEGYNAVGVDNSCAIRAEHGDSIIIVKGGSFSGGKSGIYIVAGEVENISLQGGTFEGTEAAIKILGYGLSNYTNDKSLEAILGEGYMYSPSMTIINEAYNGYNYYSYTSEKTLEIVKIPEEPAQEETTSEETPKTRNPKTSDNVINYALLFSISLLSFTIIKKIQ